ncbi:MAG: DNA/RNA non-specific endonuclease [Prevotella sp.]|nr:DNA/RNA non-specific endonuclease [Prevotella sp.]
MKNFPFCIAFLISQFAFGFQSSCAQDECLEKPAPLKGKSEIIMKRKGYAVSYNKDNKIPNWVAWHLTSERVDGKYKRTGGYQEDIEVPIPRATREDYDSTKWSHGHMCPAADNKWDERAMMESNLLTNICPQDRSLNSGLWNAIERNCRKWAIEYGDLYIVCGPVLLNRVHETIGENKIVVPETFFKVILCLNPKPKAIGFIIRNNEGKKKRDQYINTVDEVERITGIDFFPALPDEIENEVEAYANIKDWK